MVNCINCGASNEPGRTKCAYCGSTLAVAQLQQAPQPQPMYQQPQAGMMHPPGYGPGQPMYVQPMMMATPANMQALVMGQPKSMVAAALLAFFLGALGIHNFYLGYNGKGIAQLLLTLLGWAVFMVGPMVAGIWALVEFIMILARAYPDRWGRPLV